MGGSTTVADARRRGETYMLERRLFRRKSTGEVIDPDWLQFSFPTWWHYDVLRGLDYLRDAEVTPDERITRRSVSSKPVEMPRTWPLQNIHEAPRIRDGRCEGKQALEHAPSLCVPRFLEGQPACPSDWVGRAKRFGSASHECGGKRELGSRSDPYDRRVKAAAPDETGVMQPGILRADRVSGRGRCCTSWGSSRRSHPTRRFAVHGRRGQTDRTARPSCPDRTECRL